MFKFYKAIHITLRVIFIIGNTCILLLDSSVDKISDISFDSKQSRIIFLSLDTNTLDPSDLAMAVIVFQKCHRELVNYIHT